MKFQTDPKIQRFYETRLRNEVKEFETLCNKANIKGMLVLPQRYLMFLLFENSQLDEKDQHLKMIEVDFY